MIVRDRQPGDLESVLTLLETSGLPWNGIERTRGWVAEEDGQIISHIAFEEADGAVVLRSLATTPAGQGRGAASRLIELAEESAGKRKIILRSKTVGPWMLRRGYALIMSDQVPESVRSTSEFEGSMCSGYPIYMKS